MRRMCVTMRGTNVGHQCLCVGTGSNSRTSTSVHWRPTFKSRMNRHVSSLSRNESACTWNIRETCVFGRAPSVIHASAVCRMFVKYCTVFARMRRRARYVSDSSVIVNDTCAVPALFTPDSSVISTPTPRTIGQFLDAQARTNSICAWFVSDSCVIGCVTNT